MTNFWNSRTDKHTVCDAVMEYASNKPLRFHMPGHKGKSILNADNIASFDLTEISGLDNLHCPNGCIERSQKLAAELFGARRAFFLVNGSSGGLIASMLALTNDKSRVLCARNSHISLFKGLCLSGAEPLYISPEITPLGICGGINPEKIEKALNQNKDICAVFIVSPTYEGIASNVRAIAEITHRYGAVLVVDEAHGAHFKFGKSFPETALEQGADIVVQSWHKTLCALGQGAVLLLGGGQTDDDRLRFYLSAVQTTSPSYLIMSSLDKTRETIQNEGETLFKHYERNLAYLRSELDSCQSVSLMPDMSGSDSVAGTDLGKIVLFSGCAAEFDEFLRANAIFAEMTCPTHTLLMTSIMDQRHDYETLIETVSRFEPSKSGRRFQSEIYRKIPEAAFTPKQCMDRKTKRIPLKCAAGKICADFITPYPPGIPIAVPGEVITGEIAEFCAEFCESIDINGILDGKIVNVLE